MMKIYCGYQQKTYFESNIRVLLCGAGEIPFFFNHTGYNMGDRKMEGKQDETLGMETCHRLASQPGKDTIILLVASSQEN